MNKIIINKMAKRKYYYRRYYTRRRRYNKRFKYITGTSNYYKARIDIPVNVGFEATQQDTDIKIFVNNQAFTDITISNIVNNNIQYTSLKNVFDQCKLTGIKYKISPANQVQFQNPIQIAINYAPNNLMSFDSTINDNRSMTVNLRGNSQKYVPINSIDWGNSNIMEDFGYVCVRANTAANVTKIPALFTGVISLYFTFKYAVS